MTRPLWGALLGLSQRGDRGSVRPSSPAEDVRSTPSSSRWTTCGGGPRQRVKVFAFEMAPEVVNPQSAPTAPTANIGSPVPEPEDEQPWQRRGGRRRKPWWGPLAPCQHFVGSLPLPEEGTQVSQLLLRAAALGPVLIRG